MKAAIKILTILIIGSFVFGCASLPKSNKQAVIRLANNALLKGGFRLEYYEPPTAFFARGIGNQWVVKYDIKPPLSADYSFLIFVDDKTGMVDLSGNEAPDYSHIPPER